MDSTIFGTIRRITANVIYFAVFNWKFLLPIILIIGLLIFISALGKQCDSRRIEKHLDNANRARDNSIFSDGERKQIEREANHDLQILDKEKQKSNENINQIYSNLNRISNSNRAVNGTELDREAEQYRNRSNRSR